MSFRVRVLILVSLVAVTATGATAWLVLREASQQVNDSVAADRQTESAIVDVLVDYAVNHGTWEGVANTVGEMSSSYGQRIKLMTEYDVVIVDSDTLQKRNARPVIAPPTLVDPRPVIGLPTGPTDWASVVLAEISEYRVGTRLAACMTRQGLEVTVRPGPYGVARYSAGPNDPPASGCVEQAFDREGLDEDNTLVNECVKQRKIASEAGYANCLGAAFIERTSPIAPVPLRLYLGARESGTPALAAGPVIAAAALVALLAIAGTAVLSRRVLRPIGTLTAASRRLGAGDLSLRVPAVGRDELAELARSFNRMADSLQRGEERQRRLMADVAHELRTPLANLRGYLEALKDGVIPPSPDLFASLHEEAVLQQRIVDDLQDLALAEAGSLAYHRTRVDLAELLEICKNAQQAVAAEAGVTLRIDFAEAVLVPADPDRLRQVFGNLVSNAVKATPAGGTVTLSGYGSPDGWATVVVRDTGVGISAADLPHVFDRFWRADASRGRATGGSGLGLAIVRQIVSDHGGRIIAESLLGAGTTMTVVLPAVMPDELR